MNAQPLTSVTPSIVDLSRERPLAHRAVLTTREPRTFEKTRAAALGWVTRKYGDVPAASGRHQLAEHVVFSNDTTYTADGHERAIRLQLREDNLEATWRTTVIAVHDENLNHVSVSLEAFPNVDTPVPIGRPGLVRTLVASLNPFDASAVLTLAPEEIREATVSHLIDILCDPRRHKPAIVAARPMYPEPVWSDRMEKVFHQSAGAASFFVLTDAGAIRAFREQIGEAHRVATASVRTFLPEVDPAWAPDARRHRFISASNFCDPDSGTWRSVPANLHRIDTTASMPDALRTAVFPEIAEYRRERRQSAIHLIRAHETAETLREEVEELKELLTQADADISTLNDDYTLAQRNIASLEQQLAEALTQADQDAEEALRALDEAERARSEAAGLRSRLYSQNRYEEAVIAARVVRGLPVSFEELFDRAPAELDGLIVTAQRSVTVGLDVHERSATWAAKAWKGLRALNEYALAHQNISGSFYDYCKSGRGEHGWPVKEVAMSESDTTMQNWGAERIFRVPEAVESDGTATMQAHLQLERKGSICPRIHFLDNTKGATGKVIIGYIGPHLTNTKTN